MNRILVGVVGVAVVGALGVGGFWYWNQSQAREQIVASLDALREAGVETSFETLEIEGFPAAYAGVFKNFIARSPERGVAVALPEFSAGMSATSIGTVDFALPAEFFVSMLGPDGQPTGDQMFVTSDALTAAVTPTGDGAADVVLGAAKLRVARGSAGAAAADFVAFETLAATGRLTGATTPETAGIAAEATAERMTAAFLAAAAEGEEPTPATLGVERLRIAAEGDIDELGAAATAASASIDLGAGGGARLSGLAARLNATAGEGFDAMTLDALGAASTPSEIMAMLLQVVGEALAKNGTATLGVDLAKADGQFVADALGAPQLSSFETANFALKSDFGPAALTADATAERLLFQVEGVDSFSYDVGAAAVSGRLTPAERFDLAAASERLAADGPLAALVELIRMEVPNGGAASLSATSDRYETTTRIAPDFGMPFALLTTKAGKNSSAFALDKDRATLTAEGDATEYRTAEGLEGVATVGAYRFEASGPVEASSEPQAGRIGLVLGDIVLDDQLWTALDPQAALTREIGGLDLAARLDLLVDRHLLSFDPDGAEVAPPFAVQTVALETMKLDLLGFRGAAEGQMAISPAPEGAVTVTLSKWREMFAGLGQTPLGQSPQTAVAMLIATNWIDTFGAPGAAEGDTLLEFEVGPAGILVNGRPFQGG